MPTPSADDPICAKFFASMKSQNITLPGKKDSYSISFWNAKKVRNFTRRYYQYCFITIMIFYVNINIYKNYFYLIQGKADTKTCYWNEAGRNGWCGTCYEGELNPGQEGYCDYYNGK